MKTKLIILFILVVILGVSAYFLLIKKKEVIDSNGNVIVDIEGEPVLNADSYLSSSPTGLSPQEKIVSDSAKVKQFMYVNGAWVSPFDKGFLILEAKLKEFPTMYNIYKHWQMEAWEEGNSKYVWRIEYPELEAAALKMYDDAYLQVAKPYGAKSSWLESDKV